MGDWGNAEQPSEITTDDLVIMIGEYAIKERQINKTVQGFNEKIALLQQALAKEQSAQLSLKQQIETLAQDKIDIENIKSELLQAQNSFKQANEQLAEKDKNIGSLQARIVQLEEQCHQTALERDEVKKQQGTKKGLKADGQHSKN